MTNPEVRFGDKVRLTREGIVSVVDSVGNFHIDHDTYVREEHYTVEILERAPKEFKVGDDIEWSDLALLKHGTVLVNRSEGRGTPRVVDAVYKYLVLNSVDKFPFSYYDDSYFPDFFIAYIPEG